MPEVTIRFKGDTKPLIESIDEIKQDISSALRSDVFQNADKSAAKLFTTLKGGQKQIDDVVTKLHEAETVKVPTEEYAELRKEWQKSTDELVKLNEKRDKEIASFKSGSIYTKYLDETKELREAQAAFENIKKGGYGKGDNEYIYWETQVNSLEKKTAEATASINAQLDSISAKYRDMSADVKEYSNGLYHSMTLMQKEGTAFTIGDPEKVAQYTNELETVLTKNKLNIMQAQEYIEKQQMILETQERISKAQEMAGTQNPEVAKLLEERQEIATQMEELQQLKADMESGGVGVDYSGYNEVSGQIELLENQYKELTSEVNNYADAQKQAFLGANIDAGEQNTAITEKVTRMREIEQELERINREQKEFESAGKTEGYSDYDANIQQIAELKNEYAGLKADVDAYRNSLIEAGEDAEQANTRASSSTRSVADAFKSLWSDVQRTFSAIINGAKKIGSAFISMGRTAVNALKSISTSAKNVVSGLKGVAKETERNTEHLKKMALRTAKALIGVRGLFALIRKIKSAMKEGLGNIGLFDENEANQARELTAQFLQMKNALGAVLAPIRDALIPLITELSRKFVDAANSIAMFFSAITGKDTAIIAKYLDADIVKQQEDEKATKKNNKEKQKQLSKLDILNNLTSKQDNEEESVAKQMFETVKISDKVKDIIDELKSMWNTGDFTELGRKLGEKAKAFLLSIPWDKIRANARKAGKAVATFLNGLLKVEGLGYEIGKFFAQKWNTIFEFIYGFVHNLDWKAVGHFIADTFNGWFENIDWSLIEATVIEGFEGLAKTINTFVQDFHWDNLSDFISNAVNILVDGIYNFLTETDFGELFYNIGDQIAKTVDKIDWYDVGSTLGLAIQKLIESVTSFISGLSNGDYETAISDFFTGLNPMDIATTLIHLFNDAMHELGEWLRSKNWQEMGAELGDKLTKLVEEVNWKDVGEALGSIFESAIKFLKGLIIGDENGNGGIGWDKVIQALKDLLEGLGKNKELMSVLKKAGYILAGVLIGKFVLKLGTALIAKKIGTSILSSILQGAGVTESGGVVSGGAMASAGSAMGTAFGVAFGVVAGAKLGEFGVQLYGELTGDELLKNYHLGDGIKGLAQAYNEGSLQVMQAQNKLKHAFGSAILPKKHIDDADKLKEKVSELSKMLQDAGYSASTATQMIEKQMKEVGYTEDEILAAVGNSYSKQARTILDAIENGTYKVSSMTDEWIRRLDETTNLTDEEIKAIADAAREAGANISYSGSEMKTSMDGVTESSKKAKEEVKETGEQFSKTADDIKNNSDTKIKGASSDIDDLRNEHIKLKNELSTDKQSLPMAGELYAGYYENALQGLQDNAVPKAKQISTDIGNEGTTSVDKFVDCAINESRFKAPEMENAGANVTQGFIDGAESKEEEAQGFFTGFINGIKDTFHNLFNMHSPSVVMQGYGANIMTGLFNGLKATGDKIRAWVSGLVTFIIGAFNNLSNRVVNALSNISNKINTAKSFASTINVGNVGNYVGRKLRGYASGQVIPPTMQEHLALLGDNKKETEVVSPLSTMKQAMIEALMESGIGGSDRPIVVEIDGKQVFSVTRDYANDYKKRTGNYAFG